MDCKELMVGDWVSYKDDPPYIVRGTSICKVVTIDNGIDHRNVMDDAIAPIPLTEEILVKNRFALDKSLAEIGMKVYTRPCPAGDLSVKVFHDGSIRFGFIKLTYVHQLQHLLRLAGLQKEIEL